MDKIRLLQERKAKIEEAGKEIRGDIASLVDEDSFVELSAFSFSRGLCHRDLRRRRGILPE